VAIKAVIFDMDGTLVDAKDWHYESLNEALSIFGLEISRDDHINRFDGLPTRKKLELLSEERGLPRNLFQIISSIKQERTLRFIAKECFPRVEQLLMFQWIKNRGLLSAVATNSIRETAESMLRSAGVLSYLDLLITNEDVRLAKPDPEMYSLAALRLAVLPQECLVIEDNDYGVLAAEAAGCHVVKVSDVSQTRITLIEESINRFGSAK
jgi:beta-phosphoglucomutase-like phosphatase (HAD superfamily)